MIEDILEMYSQAGEWADPIILVSGILFAVGWVMLFTVRLIKRFIYYSIIALVLPNSLGTVGYVESLGDLQDAIVERGEELSEDVLESLEDAAFSPIYLGIAGSASAVILGIIGMFRSNRRAHSKDATPPRSSP